MTAPAPARLTSPGEILAVLPTLCGFVPTDSLVLLSLRGPRRRVGLTVRIDLPPDDAPTERVLARTCADRLRADGASAAVVAVYSDAGRRPRLVDAVGHACADTGVDVPEALHVAAGRWTSYGCARACCPPDGTPLPTDTAALRLVEVQRALAGQVVLGSRAELVASLAPPPAGAGATAVARARAVLGRRGHAAAATVAHADALLTGAAEGRQVGEADAALLAVGLDDPGARDTVATRMLDRGDELLSVLTQVVRRVGPPHDAQACSLLAWTAYARGNGALANVALDRALGSAPDCSLALLLRSCLDAGVPPSEVRAAVGQTARALGVRRPG